MTQDPEQLFEDLAKACPELMEKSQIGEHMGVGPGWFNIIDTLCRCIYGPVQQAKYSLKAAEEYPRDDNGEYLSKCSQKVADAIETLPTIVQVKEKFGTLRFYCHELDERNSALVEFAEAMSECTCEVCGDVGKIDNAGWIKVHCAKHRRPSDENQDEILDGSVSPKFQDDEV